MSTILRPPRLEVGDRVRVVAASGPVERQRFMAGLEALEGRYDLCFDEASLFSKHGFLAGDDDQRLEGLNSAIADPESRAIFLSRGA